MAILHSLTQGGAPDGRLPWAGLWLPRWGGTTSAQRDILRLDLPQSLIQGRIAAGLSQKELAERLGLKKQQIQRYEATDDASVSLTRVCEVARSLGLKVKAEASAA